MYVEGNHVWFIKSLQVLYVSYKVVLILLIKYFRKYESIKPSVSDPRGGLKGAIWLVERIFNVLFEHLVRAFWSLWIVTETAIRKKCSLRENANACQSPANQVAVFNLRGYGPEHWV